MDIVCRKAIYMKLKVEAGESLADSLKKRRLYIDMPCGGNGTCGRCRVWIENMGWVKSCQFRQPGEYEIRLPAARDFHTVIFEDSLAKKSQETPQCENRPLIVMDLGTTTVVMGIFYQGNYQIRTFINPQRAYGADVMSRIQRAAEGKEAELQTLLLDQVMQTLDAVWKEWGFAEQEEGAYLGRRIEEAYPGRQAEEAYPGRQAEVVVSANTAMQHLLEGLSCKGLGVSPFQPVDISLHTYRLKRSHSFIQELHITSLPGISTFIGADIVSGIYALSIMEEEEPALLLDLGTNGEMALGCKDKLLAASAAAGPAFEGSELALAIHGAGVMKLLHQMLKEHVMDETGLLADEYFDTGYLVVLDGGITSAAQNDMRITQEDIRQIQMAKAAVSAGIRVLLSEYGISPRQVAKVYLAGGMGYYLDPEDAIAIGMLPEEFAQKTKAAGNTSYQGALLYAQNPQSGGRRLKQITDTAREVVLSNHPLFEDYYMEAINFPERVGIL